MGGGWVVGGWGPVTKLGKWVQRLLEKVRQQKNAPRRTSGREKDSGSQKTKYYRLFEILSAKKEGEISEAHGQMKK